MRDVDYALFFTCRSLRRDYVREVPNPAFDHRLHVFKIDYAWSYRADLSQITALQPFPTRARKIKLVLMIRSSRSNLPGEPFSVGKNGLPNPLRFVKEFLKSFEFVEHVIISAWGGLYFRRHPAVHFSSILEEMGSVRAYSIVG
jgi:hypothetical protein